MNFGRIITTAFNESFRLVRLSQKQSKDKKWMTAGLVACSRTKVRLHKKWLKTRILYETNRNHTENCLNRWLMQQRLRTVTISLICISIQLSNFVQI